MQAAQTPIAEAGEAQMYLSAVVGDMTGFVGVSARLEREVRPRVFCWTTHVKRRSSYH